MKNCILVKDLYKTFRVGFFRKKAEILRGVSFEVDEGEVFGFLGPNGSGKTTTIKTLLGLIFPDKGSAEVLGRPIREVKFKSQIGFLPESPYFYDYLTGEEFLRFYAQLFGLRGKSCESRIDSLLEAVDLKAARKLPLRKYSKGMLQRIGMAQALINEPRLVILDEPMTGLDPIGRKKIRDIILGLKGEGKTVFFSTHILSDVEMICDRVAIMVRGKIHGLGMLSELLTPKVRSVEVCFKKCPSEILIQLQKEYSNLSIQGDQIFLTVQEEDLDPLVLKLAEKKIRIVSLIPHRESLEELFMSEVL